MANLFTRLFGALVGDEPAPNTATTVDTPEPPPSMDKDLIDGLVRQQQKMMQGHLAGQLTEADPGLLMGGGNSAPSVPEPFKPQQRLPFTAQETRMLRERTEELLRKSRQENIANGITPIGWVDPRTMSIGNFAVSGFTNPVTLTADMDKEAAEAELRKLQQQFGIDVGNIVDETGTPLGVAAQRPDQIPTERQSRLANLVNNRIVVSGDRKSGKDFSIMLRIHSQGYRQSLVLCPNTATSLEFSAHAKDYLTRFTNLTNANSPMSVNPDTGMSVTKRYGFDGDKVLQICNYNDRAKYVPSNWDTVIVNEADLCDNKLGLMNTLAAMFERDGMDTVVVGTEYGEGSLLEALRTESRQGEWTIIKLPWKENVGAFSEVARLVLDACTDDRAGAKDVLPKFFRIGGWPPCREDIAGMATDPWSAKTTGELLSVIDKTVEVSDEDKDVMVVTE